MQRVSRPAGRPLGRQEGMFLAFSELT